MILSMQDLSYRRQGKTILEDINWQVRKGETWAVLGLNGAGKSTLLRILMAEFWKR
ncbi:Hemin import ATP-binding protein HmuV [Chlamydia trachomatis]|nr:Hemin import ATP-binding protein HmuV [Chlamydia trachomatis]CRH94119.1 Hemin import ATP-binding protein HmuV [Chlamydia trachomatis]